MTDESERVVYLAWDNPTIMEDETVSMLACRQCRNKTYRIEVYENCGGRVYCTACGSYIGKMGWMPEED